MAKVRVASFIPPNEVMVEIRERLLKKLGGISDATSLNVGDRIELSAAEASTGPVQDLVQAVDSMITESQRNLDELKRLRASLLPPEAPTP